MAKRRGAMTERERVEALLNHRKPDRVPIRANALGFYTRQFGASIADYYNNPEVSLAAQRKVARDFGWVFWPRIAYASWGGWEFGGEIKWPSGEFTMAPTVARRPVNTVEDAVNLKMPDVKNSGIVPIATELYKMSSQERLDNEPFNVMIPQEGPFVIASNIPGMSIFAKWLIKEPEAAHRLLRLTTDYVIELMRYWKGLFGIDGVLPGYAEAATSNQVISPKQFEQFALPYLKEFNEKMVSWGYKHIYVHICGDQNLNLPYWAQIPMGDPGILSFGHEVDLETAARYFPNDIIVGNLEPAIIQVGTPEEVYEASRKVIEKGKKLPGGFIFGPGCELPPNAPVENVIAMTRAVNDFGWYD